MRSRFATSALALLAAASLPGRTATVAMGHGHVVTLCTARGTARIMLPNGVPLPPDRNHDEIACHASCLSNRKCGEWEPDEGNA